jgi:tetratricopeptide (TPR) repeat protein
MHDAMKRDGSLESMEDAMPASKMDVASRTLSPRSVLPDVHDDVKTNAVVDWIKQLVDDKVRSSSSFKTPIKSVSQESFAHSASTKTPPKHPLSPPVTKMPMTVSFRKQSEAVGAGWNAKGIQKATKQDWEGALQCWENALEIRIQVLGDNHKDVANTMNNAGIAMGRLGREEEAMEHLQKALAIRIRLHGTEHADVAATLHNIGNVNQQRGDFQGALESFIEAKRIQQHLLGDSTVQVARAWNAIGHVHFEVDDYKEARDAYCHALDTFKRVGRAEDDLEVEHTMLDLKEAEQLLLA